MTDYAPEHASGYEVGPQDDHGYRGRHRLRKLADLDALIDVARVDLVPGSLLTDPDFVPVIKRDRVPFGFIQTKEAV